SATVSFGSRVNKRRMATAQHVPTTVGTMSTTEAPDRDRTAAQPAIPANATARLAIGLRRVSYPAASAAMAATTATTITDRNSLSEVPNVWIAHSLTGPGVRSMIADPTAFRASAAGPNGTATSCATPRPTAAAAMPTSVRGADPDMPPRYR